MSPLSTIGLALYSLALQLARPLLSIKLRRRGRAEPGYLQAQGERLGRYSGAAVPGAVWIHAVSLGETRAAGVLVEALRARDPGMRLLLTHGTATGRAEGQRWLRPGDAQAWLPWDTPAAVAAFLDHFRPAVGVLMETEVWPNLVQACARRRLPLALANARLSEKSLAGARRLSVLSQPAYAALAAVWAQTEGDAHRLQQAGARVDAVVGNLKFDATPHPDQTACAQRWRQTAHPLRATLMLASSREGEEAAVLQHWRPGPDAPRLLLVPRHPQRFDEVAQQVQAAGLRLSRRSRWSTEGPDAQAQEADVWLGDSLGEMALYYGLADVALLGGSFAPLGGQNLIEASACGCPLVLGPHTFNFAEAADLALASGAALRAGSLPEALGQALSLLADAPRRQAMRASGLEFAQAHRGAADRTAQAVLALRAAAAC